MPMLLRAYQIHKSVADVEAFAQALTNERQAEAAAFYRRYGVSHESWHLQHTEFGLWLISLTVVDNPTEVAPQYAATTDEFEKWFKDQVRDLSGVDSDKEPLGPQTMPVFTWSDPERPNSDLCGAGGSMYRLKPAQEAREYSLGSAQAEAKRV